MKTWMIVLASASFLVLGGVPGAEAKGCLKGAAVGGVAGHMAGHHGVLGAAGGCAVGHHEAAKHDRQAAQAQQNTQSERETGNQAR